MHAGNHRRRRPRPRIRVIISENHSGPLMAWRKMLYEARDANFTWLVDT